MVGWWGQRSRQTAGLYGDSLDLPEHFTSVLHQSDLEKNIQRALLLLSKSCTSPFGQSELERSEKGIQENIVLTLTQDSPPYLAHVRRQHQILYRR